MMKRALILAAVIEGFLGLALLFERLWLHFSGRVGSIDFLGFVTHVPGLFVYSYLNRLVRVGYLGAWFFYVCVVATNALCGTAFIACVLYLKSRFSWKAAAAYLAVPLAAGLLGMSVSWCIISRGYRAEGDHESSNEIRSSFAAHCAMASFYENLCYDWWFGGEPPPKGLRFRLEAVTIAGVDYALRGMLLASAAVGLYALVRRLRRKTSEPRGSPASAAPPTKGTDAAGDSEGREEG